MSQSLSQVFAPARVALAVAALVAMPACRSYCERAAELTASCGPTGLDPFDLDACKARVSDCSAGDKAVLHDYLDCIEDIPDWCTSSDAAAIAKCTALLDGLEDPTCAE